MIVAIAHLLRHIHGHSIGIGICLHGQRGRGPVAGMMLALLLRWRQVLMTI